LAIDPLTAKLLAQAAARAATDEESRRRTLILILAPILGLLLLIAFILYLITSPFSMLSQWLVGDEVSVVENFQKEYGYNQQLGIYEKDYIEGSGQSYEGVVFTDGGREVIYYNQLDERWADTMYGTSGTIGEAGCGPTAMAIVTSTLTGTPHDPVELSEWSVANGHRCEGNGSYHSLIPAAAEGVGDPLTEGHAGRSQGGDLPQVDVHGGVTDLLVHAAQLAGVVFQLVLHVGELALDLQ